MSRSALLGLVVGGVLASVVPAHADTKCTLDFHLEGWSMFYKESRGGGTISCDNGQKARIVIRTKGGGITVGAEKIVDGYGEFSPVSDISELFGDYANAEAHAGMGKASDAQVVTKGSVSLAFSGKGHGVNVGIAFGKFTIAHAARRHVEHRVEEHTEDRVIEKKPLEENLDEHEPAPAPAPPSEND